MARRGSTSGGGGDEWLATYADMVTLLMCFFVLLFSMSTISEQKFEELVRSFNPTASEPSQIVTTPGDGNDLATNDGDAELATQESDNPATSDDIPRDMTELYEYLQAYVEENDLSSSVTIQQEDDFIFIRFNDNLFFHPDSSVLLDGALPILEVLSTGLVAVDNDIQSIRVNGYTAEIDGPSFVNDRFLSSDRANEVAVTFEDAGVTDAKIIAVGYGKNYPIADNSTEEGRAQNRRVEVIILGMGFDPSDPESLSALAQSGLDPAFYSGASPGLESTG